MSEDIVKVINNENPVINLEITAYKNIVDVDFLQSIDSVIAGHNEYIDAHRKIQDEVALKANLQDVTVALSAKVDAVSGKGLSENDFTNELKSNYDKAYANNHKHNNQSALDSVQGINTGDQDISALATKTFNNISLPSALVNLGFLNQSLTANGYYKFPKGLIIQWGAIGANASSITFPIAFPTALFIVILTGRNTTSAGTAVNWTFSTVSQSVTGFTVIAPNFERQWFAIGF